MINFKITHLKRTESTNAFLKNKINKEFCPEGTVVLTKEQTHGKGQQGNSWESEKDKNLTFSFLLKPPLGAHKMFIVSKVVSLAIIDLLNSFGEQFTIKWPNDIYYHNQKIAGILIENQLLGSNIKHSVIGIGLNVNQKVFKSNAPNPISLVQIFNKEFDAKHLLETFFKKLYYWYNQLLQQNYDLINISYKKSAYRLNGYHKYTCNNEFFEAKIIDIAEDGQLKLETSDGKQREFYFKEVEFCLPAKY